MTRQMFNQSLFAMCLGSVLCCTASAAVLDPDRRDELCVAGAGGQLSVDPNKLAWRIVREADLPPHVLQAAITKDNAIDDAEVRFAVTDDRFRNNLSPKLAERLDAVLIQELQGDLNNGFAGGDAYKVRKLSPVAATVPGLFSTPATVVIDCKSPEGGAPAEVSQKTTAFFDSLRLRGTVDDLAKYDIKDAEFAKVSYQQDYRSRESTVSVDAVVGAIIGSDPGNLLVLPYAHYQRVDATGKEDIHTLSPGLLVHFFNVSPQLGFALEAGLSLEDTIDIAKDSQKATLSGYLRPTWGISEGVIINGGYGDCVGPFTFNPQFDVLAEGAAVMDAGTSAELAATDGYLGLGAKASISGRMCGKGPLSKLELKADISDLEFVAGSLPRDRAFRQEYSVAYTLPSYENVSIKASYINGNNSETFESERRFEVSLGLRF